MDNSQDMNGTISKSQFLQKVDTIPVVHNMWLSLVTRYSLIKVSYNKIIKKPSLRHYSTTTKIWNVLSYRFAFQDTHPVLKEGLELGEKTATWAEEKAAYLVTVTNLDQPLKKIDHAALNGVVQLENTQNQVSLIDKTLRSLKSIVNIFPHIIPSWISNLF